MTSDRRAQSSRDDPPALTLSVVSHGQGSLVCHLLTDLRQGLECSFEILITINIPEDEGFLAGFEDLPIRIIRNVDAKGFGANHNAAFAQSEGTAFAVVNPDIRVRSVDLRPLLGTLQAGRIGACGPVVVNARNHVEDSARRFPSVARLIRRIAARIMHRPLTRDYAWLGAPIRVDWVAGMFVIYSREAYAEVGGFDEGYFMYLEDADICRRLAKRGWFTMLDPRVTIVHDAQRASHRSVKHLRWHLASAWRFMTRG